MVIKVRAIRKCLTSFEWITCVCICTEGVVMGQNSLWLLGSCLILMLFTGFAIMQKSLQLAKTVKKKDVAFKRTIVTILVGFFAFASLGIFVMFGLTSWGGQAEGLPPLFIIFQSLLCVTTIIIATAASYGRLPARIYIYLALFVSLILYPFLGRLLWHDLLGVYEPSWLAKMGFRDIAGATLIHSVAGWVALATLIMFGLRKKSGVGVKHRLGLRLLSALCISLGMFTIIAVMASLHVSDFRQIFAEAIVPTALTNALYASFSALVVALVVSLIRFRRVHVQTCTSAFIAGLVAISGAAFSVGMVAAVIIGCVASLLMIVTASILEALNIDDALNIVPTHLVAGIWGSVAVGIFANTELLGSQLAMSEQLAIQVMGITFYGLVSFLPTCIFLWLLARLNLLGIYSKQSKQVVAKKANTMFNTFEEDARARKTLFKENSKATQALSILTSYDASYDPKNPNLAAQEQTKKNLETEFNSSSSTDFNTEVVVNDQATLDSGVEKTSVQETSAKESVEVEQISVQKTSTKEFVQTPQMGRIARNITNHSTKASIVAIAEKHAAYQKRYPTADVQAFIELLEDQVKTTKPANYTTSLVLSKLSDLRTSRLDKETKEQKLDNAFGSDIIGMQLFSTALADTLSHAENLNGLITAQFVNDMYFASALHRISTIGVDDELLFDIGKFDGQDYSDLEEQSSLSVSLIEDVAKKSKKKIKSQSLVQMCLDIAKAHQERWDGTGQPNGVKAEDIPLPARIVSLVDSYIYSRINPDATLSHPRACQQVLMNSMKQFDPVIVHHFFRINELVEDNFSTNFSSMIKKNHKTPTLEQPVDQVLTNGQGEVINPGNTMELLIDL